MSLDAEGIAKLKVEHGEVFAVTVGKVEYIFRALTFGEFNIIMNTEESSADTEDLVVETALLYPLDVNFDRLSAGAITSLAGEILDVSGFTDIDSCLQQMENARVKAGSAIAMMQAFVIASGQQYSAKEFDGFTFQTLADKVALAEQVLELQAEVMRGSPVKMSFVAPDEEEQEQDYSNPDKYRQFTDEEINKINRSQESSSTIGQARGDDPIARKLREALG